MRTHIRLFVFIFFSLSFFSFNFNSSQNSMRWETANIGKNCIHYTVPYHTMPYITFITFVVSLSQPPPLSICVSKIGFFLLVTPLSMYLCIVHTAYCEQTTNPNKSRRFAKTKTATMPSMNLLFVPRHPTPLPLRLLCPHILARIDFEKFIWQSHDV